MKETNQDLLNSILKVVSGRKEISEAPKKKKSHDCASKVEHK